MSKGNGAKEWQEWRAFEVWLAGAHLEFYPFQELGLARADQRPLCCVHPNGMSGHNPSSCLLITVGTPYPGQDQAWGVQPGAHLGPELSTCPGSVTHSGPPLHPRLPSMALPSTPSSQIQTSDCAHLTLVTYIRILKIHLPRVESVPHHVAGLPQTLLHFIFCNFIKMDDGSLPAFF